MEDGTTRAEGRALSAISAGAASHDGKAASAQTRPASTSQPEILTERLLLRPLRDSDAGLLALYAGDRRVAEMTTSIPHPFPPGAAEALIARAGAPDRDEDFWAIDGSASGLSEFLGLISLLRLDDGQSEVRFWIGPAFWKSGFASEALKGLVAANPHDSRTLFAAVFQDNPASARVLVNAGFDYLGEAEAHSVARGATVPTWTYIRRMKTDGSA